MLLSLPNAVVHDLPVKKSNYVEMGRIRGDVEKILETCAIDLKINSLTKNLNI